MRLKINGPPMFRIVGVVDPFIRGLDFPVVGLKYRVFKEKTKRGHLGDHHPSWPVHLISTEVQATLKVADRSAFTSSITSGGVPVRTESMRAAIILR